MALSAESVEKGHKALSSINQDVNSDYISEFRKDDKPHIDRIFGYSRVQDGWENLFTHIKDMTTEQREMWNEQKNVIHNSSFDDDLGNGITRIGWF